MQFDKQQLLNLLHQQGQHDQANQAEQELPQRVDTDQDAGLLQKYHINPQELIQKFTGGGGSQGGGTGGGIGR